MEERTTKGHLMISVITLVLENYPTRWTVDELTLATGEKRRRVERLIKELADSRLLEKSGGRYTLHIRFLDQIFGARWYLTVQRNKDILLKKREMENGNSQN